MAKGKVRTDIFAREQEIRYWINQNQSKAFMCKQLHCKPITLESYLKKMGITYEGNQGGRGIKIDPTYKTAEEYSHSKHVNGTVMKNKLIRDGVKEDKCECCGLTYWYGKKISLEIHHKDGDHYNNDLDNLALLCPNCHAIQEIHNEI